MLLSECADLIKNCKPSFADPAITEVEWKRKDKPVEVKLPAGTQEPTIPDDLKEQIEWKKGTAKKPPVLKFRKALTQDVAENAKELFGGDEAVVNAIDAELSRQQSGNVGGDTTGDGDIDL